MKSLKFDHNLAQQIMQGKKTSTWRLFDDKDLHVNDTVTLIDKVTAGRPETWEAIGTARIDTILQKRLGDIASTDMTGHEAFSSRDAMKAQYQQYYGSAVTWQTPVKIIDFTFTPFGNGRAAGDTGPAMPIRKAAIYADGGSRGNPGPSASGFLIYDDQQRVVVKRGVYIGVTTNNQAEYTALKLALEEAEARGVHELAVFMDSLLVINQMKGIFKVKNRDLWPIHDAIMELCRHFKHVTFTQIPRELNKMADAAVNEALDAHQEQIRGGSQDALR